MSATNEIHQEGLSRSVQASALANLANQPCPLARREKCKAALFLENPIGNEQTLVAVTLQRLAETGRDADPSLFVSRMVKSSAEHRNPPLPPTTSHSIPPQSSESECCRMAKIDGIVLTSPKRKKSEAQSHFLIFFLTSWVSIQNNRAHCF